MNKHDKIFMILMAKPIIIIFYFYFFNYLQPRKIQSWKLSQLNSEVPLPNRALKETLLIEIPSASAIVSTISNPTWNRFSYASASERERWIKIATGAIKLSYTSPIVTITASRRVGEQTSCDSYWKCSIWHVQMVALPNTSSCTAYRLTPFCSFLYTCITLPKCF